MISVFIGGRQLSAAMLTAIRGADPGLCAVFCPSAAADGQHSDYANLRHLGVGLSYVEYEDLNAPATVAAVAGLNPDVVYVLGTSQIVKAPLLETARLGVIGGHMASLPQNRGCSPLIWAIANGLTESAVTLFWMNVGTDTGDIAGQRGFAIPPYEHAGQVYPRATQAYCQLLTDELIPALARGEVPRKSQSGTTNYWRKRRPTDGRIDWRMSATRIHNLVRALHPPYPGADFTHRKSSYQLLRTRVAAAPENRYPGEILEIEGREVLVKAGEGAVWLLEHNFDPTITRVGRFFY